MEERRVQTEEDERNRMDLNHACKHVSAPHQSQKRYTVLTPLGEQCKTGRTTGAELEVREISQLKLVLTTQSCIKTRH